MACFSALFLIGFPLLMVWLFRRFSQRWRDWRLSWLALMIWGLGIMPVCYLLLALMVTIVAEQQAVLSPFPYRGGVGEIYPQGYTVTQGYLHGLAGWEGVDLKAGCGASIYAPFDGVVTYNGNDGYVGFHSGGEENTMITIVGEGKEITLLHGRYSAAVGEMVGYGDVIGQEASIGDSTGCHSHVVLKVNGRLVNYLSYASEIVMENKPLKISWYDPELGGINCAHPCDTMASGVKVTPERYGRTAACVPEWMGRTVVIPGLGEFECLDTGGAIVEHPTFIWIDLLMHQPPAEAGQLVSEWYLR